MAADIPRLVAACDRELLRQLVETIAPDRFVEIDWSLVNLDLGRSVQTALNGHPCWSKLQNIAALAEHGGITLIRSVLHCHDGLVAELDNLAELNSETAAVWLALRDDERFQEAVSAMHADRGLGKRSWKAFKLIIPDKSHKGFEGEHIERFKAKAVDAIRACRTFDSPGQMEIHHFERVIFPDSSHNRRKLDQVTVFTESRAITDQTFEEARLVTLVRKKVDSISILFCRERNEIDVVSIGGKRFLEDVARAFCHAFLDATGTLEPLIKRTINYQKLRTRPQLDLAGQDRFVSAKIDEIRLKSPSDMLCTFDAKAFKYSDKDVYDLAERDFGDRNPFRREGWLVASARLRLEAAPTAVGRKRRFRTVELKPNERTNLAEQNDDDRFIADDLLTRWGILEPGDDE